MGDDWLIRTIPILNAVGNSKIYELSPSPHSGSILELMCGAIIWVLGNA